MLESRRQSKVRHAPICCKIKNINVFIPIPVINRSDIASYRVKRGTLLPKRAKNAPARRGVAAQAALYKINENRGECSQQRDDHFQPHLRHFPRPARMLRRREAKYHIVVNTPSLYIILLVCKFSDNFVVFAKLLLWRA